MLTKFFELTSDLFLSLVLLGIITTAAVSVVTLSPLTAEDYGYEAPTEQVLGESTSIEEESSDSRIIYNNGDLSISDILQEHTFFKSESTNEFGFSQNIEFGPASAGTISKEVFAINNNTSGTKSFLVSMSVPEEYKSLASYGLAFNEQDFVMISEDGQALNFLDGSIGPDSNIKFELFVELKENLNFPINITIDVDEVASR